MGVAIDARTSTAEKGRDNESQLVQLRQFADAASRREFDLILF
jgi:hypothetical protein